MNTNVYYDLDQFKTSSFNYLRHEKARLWHLVTTHTDLKLFQVGFFLQNNAQCRPANSLQHCHIVHINIGNLPHQQDFALVCIAVSTVHRLNITGDKSFTNIFSKALQRQLNFAACRMYACLFQCPCINAVQIVINDSLKFLFQQSDWGKKWYREGMLIIMWQVSYCHCHHFFYNIIFLFC